MSLSRLQARAWEALELGPIWTEKSPVQLAQADEPKLELRADCGNSQAKDRSWEQVKQDVANCRLCGLCEKRSQTVFASANPGPRIMLIGEAPGEQEDATGQPFVGPAGQLLTHMLKAIGLDRDRDVLIVNAVKCRPPENRNPSAQEMASCLPWLQEQIAIAKPQVLFLLGKFAVSAVLGKDEPLAQMRGLVHQTSGGLAAVVTYHPAYLLRRLPEKAKAWEDLLLLKRQLS